MTIKTRLSPALIAGAALTLGACSITDHANDYQDTQAETKPLEVPEGSLQTANVLVIPNEDKVASLEGKHDFVAPRAAFLYHSMARVSLEDKRIELFLVSQPAIKMLTI